MNKPAFLTEVHANFKAGRICLGRGIPELESLRENWKQIWRVAGRESGTPELLGSPRTSPEVPRTSPEVFRRLPRKLSHCGTKQQSRGSPEVSRTSPAVSQTSPEVSRTSPEVSPFLWEA